MRTFALLTLNRTDEAKSRLSSILSPDERKQLVILIGILKINMVVDH